MKKTLKSQYKYQEEKIGPLRIERVLNTIRKSAYNLKYSDEAKIQRISAIVDQAYNFWMQGKVLYKSEITLGKEYGVCSGTISRDIQALESTYLLEVRHRFNNSNVYLPSVYCFIPEIMKELIKWFPCLQGILSPNVELTKDIQGNIIDKEEDKTLLSIRYFVFVRIGKFSRALKDLTKQKHACWEYFCSGLEYVPPNGDEMDELYPKNHFITTKDSVDTTRALVVALQVGKPVKQPFTEQKYPEKQPYYDQKLSILDKSSTIKSREQANPFADI